MNFDRLNLVLLMIVLLGQLVGCGVKSAPVPERPLPSYEAQFQNWGTNPSDPEAQE